MSRSASPETVVAAAAAADARDPVDTQQQQEERPSSRQPSEEKNTTSREEEEEGEEEEGGSSSEEEGAASPVHSSRRQSGAGGADDAPPLPEEPVPSASEAPPLPQEVPPPAADDDGWDCQWDPYAQSWFFHNRLTGRSQWENPRVPPAAAAAAAPSDAAAPPLPADSAVAGGYNPAIHGDYDPNAWYAKGYANPEEEEGYGGAETAGLVDVYASTAQFNRFNGQFQTADAGPGRHTDEAKSRRQMNAFFDVDAAANAHDGRSLRAERSHQKPSKSELKAFKEKRRARKEEKRRAWLRD
ncbi:WW domain-containing protein [Geosmithia morbida]|uniref:WW domain-containing protein n=1 Tax=Geosmithia morbida TaxID=1094350 RepID=A0A9P5D246_9HYPO|nr:WW domain-containing protein [Geosmithia morbida]KAF4121126.1 WW domain-containing protein [Geosmithia morbida]